MDDSSVISATCILALIDNKAKEIGIALINFANHQLLLSQFTETSSTFDNLFNLILLHSPSEIVFPVTMENSKLVKLIQHENPRLQLTFIARKFYNETKEYVEYQHSTKYAPETLKFHYHQIHGYMLLHNTTLTRLEVLTSLSTTKDQKTLFSVLNHTKTPMGKRLLKTSLIQPLNDIQTINTRLDCVSELLSNEKSFFDISMLAQLPDIDYVISQFVKEIPSKKMTACFVSLFKILVNLKPLCKIVSTLENPLFKVIHQTLSHENIDLIIKEIQEVFDESQLQSKKVSKNQHLFAIKKELDGLLDVCRNLYSENINLIQQEYSSLLESSGISSLKLKTTPTRGYYLTCDIQEALDRSVFIQVNKKNKNYTFTTQNIISLNSKVQDTSDEILLISDKILKDLLTKIQKKLGCLYKVSESIALLDLIYSFAELVSINNDYTRPEVTKNGPIAVKEGRDPIVEARVTSGFYIPNDTYISENSNVQLIFGPNMSGKSTLLLQIGHICIMAHIGCYVPAKFASIRVLDRIFTRIGGDDSLEGNMSTFYTEMKEIAYIMNNATKNSLVLIDELGRGTSSNEGCSITWSVCEQIKGFVVFVTHFLLLSELSHLYPNIKSFHFNVSPTDGKLNFLYSLSEGSCSEDRYGLKLAKMIGMKDQIIDRSEELCKFLEKDNQITLNTIQTSELKVKYALAQKLLNLRYSSMNLDELTDYLKTLKK